MSKHHQDIQVYLSELEEALQGQPAGFIQDALYDAESHLYDALFECPTEGIQEIVESYGSPADIASLYIQMEKDSQVFINGPDASRPRFNGFFQPLFYLRDYKALGYFFIELPLSIIYFAWIVLFGVPSLVLSVLVIGTPLLALFLRIQCYLALFEGQLINTLLGVRMPRRPARMVSRQTTDLRPIQLLISIIKAPHGWKTTLYAAIQLPLSMTYFGLGCLLFIGSLALMASPIIDPIIHYFSPHLTIDFQWYWFPITTIIGVIGLTLSMHISRALVKLHSSIATYLLIEN